MQRPLCSSPPPGRPRPRGGMGPGPASSPEGTTDRSAHHRLGRYLLPHRRAPELCEPCPVQTARGEQRDTETGGPPPAWGTSRLGPQRAHFQTWIPPATLGDPTEAETSPGARRGAARRPGQDAQAPGGQESGLGSPTGLFQPKASCTASGHHAAGTGGVCDRGPAQTPSTEHSGAAAPSPPAPRRPG